MLVYVRQSVFAIFFTIAVCWMAGCSSHRKTSAMIGPSIPVTSQLLESNDDPEFQYSGAPRFDWPFFENRMNIIAKWLPTMAPHRNVLGVDNCFNLIETKSFEKSPDDMEGALSFRPTLPTLLFAKIGKSNYHIEDHGECPRSFAIEQIRSFMKDYPHTIYGGGQVAEVDSIFNWQYRDYFGRLPIGIDGQVFPAAWLDFTESNLRRGAVPYMLQQHNRAWGMHYLNKERVMSLSHPQLFYRHDQLIAPSLITARSASRQCFSPFGVQFSGQTNFETMNPKEVIEKGADPILKRKVSVWGENYHKSFALSRQVLYLAWMNGARYFNWETGEFMWLDHNGERHFFPTPLGRFTARADEFIQRVGRTGPVQTPIALVSEFSRTWRPPSVHPDQRRIQFSVLGDVPYEPGDYQMHGVRDLLIPHYLQCEMIYAHAMTEDYAIHPTPYGESFDFLLSDVRKEALARYGLLIWAGVPPRAPSMVREKLLDYIRNSGGRAVLFGITAKTMFPDWFEESPTAVPRGAKVQYHGENFSETEAFVMQSLKQSAVSKIPGLSVLATVNSKPLVIECMSGLVLVLSDYGINSEPSVNPSLARWKPGEIIDQIPHLLLGHARRLLEDEARKQTLFSVSNANLHYVITRPARGEYLLGLFNDSMKSQPFEITSNIGRVKSIIDLELKDGVEDLKTVVNGAAYAPPGLRKPSDLPLDYGLSDDAHIEGRGVRIFRIRVDEEGVRQIPRIEFPERPAGHVLAVPGLEHIRRYLQGMTMFFSWFDGVQVEAEALLSIEPSRLVEQGHYLDRRGVRVVVDGTALDEKSALRVIHKLALLKKAPKDLVVSAPTRAVRARAQQAGVRLVAPHDVNRLAGAGEHFNHKAMLNIVELYYDNEEDLFLDWNHFNSRSNEHAPRGKSRWTTLRKIALPPGASESDVVDVGSYVHDLKDLITSNSKVFGAVAGIKIDATYLLSKTKGHLAEDRRIIEKLVGNRGPGRKSRVVVDLRRDQVLFDRICFYPAQPQYEAGLQMYRETLDRMVVIGARDLVLRIHDTWTARRHIKEYARLRDEEWGKLASMAREVGIALHLICDPDIKFSPRAAQHEENVFIIRGPEGKPSPYRLLTLKGSIGSGETNLWEVTHALSPEAVPD
jgi:hypothetical protein